MSQLPHPPIHRPAHPLRNLVGVRLVGWARLATISALWALASTVLASCHDTPEESPQTEAPENSAGVPERGVHVVFEKVAGEFLEGTVLERSGDRLRVQTYDGQASVNVTAAGVYPLGKSHLESEAGSYAVCGIAPRRWEGCQVIGPDGKAVSIVSPDDTKHTLQKDRVLALNNLSQTNVQRAFERATKRRAFESDLVRAGAPTAPKDWHPRAGERVIALRRGEWYTAHIHEFEKDGAIRVRWRNDGEIERLERASIIPEPPYQQAIERGDFALLRPKAESSPWIAVKVRVVEADGAHYKVQDINDQRYEALETALVPLGR